MRNWHKVDSYRKWIKVQYSDMQGHHLFYVGGAWLFHTVNSNANMPILKVKELDEVEEAIKEANEILDKLEKL